MEAMKEDFFAIGNDELEGRPTIKDSKFAVCPNCKKDHAIEYGRNALTHEISKALAFVKCKNGSAYLVAINGKILPHPKHE
jgi:hypothetical protein